LTQPSYSELSTAPGSHDLGRASAPSMPLLAVGWELGVTEPF
jgi:hypothetical protein